jgi:1,4-alpha-glucan branching enzyme
VDTHGILNARPRPRYGVFAPIFTPNGVAVFGRDLDSARQVWSRNEGYPGDFRYRDFYRDIGFDLDFDYIKPYLAAPDKRSFTGIKYYRITGTTTNKEVYNRNAALQAAAEHARNFLQARIAQTQKLAGILDRPPLLLSPYDAELFGHWWYEGPKFLDYFVRKAHYDQHTLQLITPEEYLRLHPTNQVATPSASSWGEEGYWRTWLNESNQWIYPHIQVAQDRMTQMVRRFKKPGKLADRALKQAARELLLAQSSDWPFILRTGTSPDYARRRVKDHLLRFIALHEQLTQTRVDERWLTEIESRDNIFPDVNYRYWA